MSERPLRRYEVTVPCRGASVYYVEATSGKEAERMVWERDPSVVDRDAPYINESGRPRARRLRALDGPGE